MACCNCCCPAGCCGGSSGTCCAEGEYCCDGECEQEPCCSAPDESVCSDDENCNYCVKAWGDGGACCDTGGVELICPEGFISVIGTSGDIRYCYQRTFIGRADCPCEAEAGTIQIQDENSVAYTVSQTADVVQGYCCDDGCSYDTCPP